jgi:hypothetical protein
LEEFHGGYDFPWTPGSVVVIIPYYIEFNGPVMAYMKIKTVQTILLSAM